MVLVTRHARRRLPLALAALLVWLASAPVLGAADTREGAADWEALQQRSQEALEGLARDRHDAPSGHCEPPHAATPPHLVVVGFTGGLEGAESGTSGVVRLRRHIEERFGAGNVVALAYSNFSWRSAAEDVAELAAAPGACRPPAIVVYGHSWGAGAIGKFARELRRAGLDIALAIYIDAFTLRVPRVPDNVRYAVNIYQRTGVFRGFPLRGKGKLAPESPADTEVLASLRITPRTDHFGWHWVVLQPLLYRHHHRISHDERIRDYVLELIDGYGSLGAPSLAAGS
jgi:hypothetical protein